MQASGRRKQEEQEASRSLPLAAMPLLYLNDSERHHCNVCEREYMQPGVSMLRGFCS